MTPLDKIIADGEELCAAIVDVEPDRAPDILVNAALVGYARQHLPTLLAVARAAVECERDPWGGGFAALRAAVRGEGKEKANGR
jgi:hypothetical protein